MISREDEERLREMGISRSAFDEQLANFEAGFKFSDLIAPAKLNDGIQKFDRTKAEWLVEHFEHFKDSIDILKFIPASGAATRMFKDLYEAATILENRNTLSEKGQEFFDNLAHYPFYSTLKSSLASKDKNLDTLLENGEYASILNELLLEGGLKYGNLPKALIPFHLEAERAILPLEEHVREGVEYAETENLVKLHFTVSSEHLKPIKMALKKIGRRFSTHKIEVSYSLQSESTNTVAVYLDNQPVRTEQGDMLFRPGGHGALLHNLNQLDAEMVFIKNIDNVCKAELQANHTINKKLLAGRLLEVRAELHHLLNKCDTPEGKKEAIRFIKFRWGKEVSTLQEIRSFLDRPIRVCGMVENTGAPGGGPFWIKKDDGSKSLQIVESSQIDMENPIQKQIFEESTHFNPVDLVCWIKNFKGEKFDLLQYRNDKAGFITQKYFEGQVIKAQELPGLWNGAMANWITEFVEVPLETFNPVKTVFDLLNKGHR
ncbi:MAG: DUF4301 family protein [Flavobacteriales bacterium]|nr:DUF4301 family protein [Flavobacteriales bacterium]